MISAIQVLLAVVDLVAVVVREVGSDFWVQSF